MPDLSKPPMMPPPLDVDDAFNRMLQDFTNSSTAHIPAAPTQKAVEPCTLPTETPPLVESTLFSGFTPEPSGLQAGRARFSDVFGAPPQSAPDTYGRVFDASHLNPGQLSMVPVVDPLYYLDPEVIEPMWMSHCIGESVFLNGKPGVGKSSVVEQFCARIGQPLIRINGRGDLESSALLGQVAAGPEGTYWVDGPVTTAVREGALLLLDEVSAIPADIMLSLQWLSERGGKLLLADMPAATGERMITPHPDFRIIMADNTRGAGDDTAAYAGTEVMNSATLNRVGTTLNIDWMRPDQEASILAAKYPHLSASHIETACALASSCRKSFDAGTVSVPLSLRGMQSWCDKLMCFAQMPAVDRDDDVRIARRAFDLAYTNLLPTADEQAVVHNLFAVHMNG